MIPAGTYAYNLATGQTRLVIAVDGQGNVTFAGDHRWYPAQNWVSSVIPRPTHPTPKGSKA